MAQLSAQDRAFVTSEFARLISDRRDALGALTKPQLRAAVDGLDDFVNTNAATINAAIPLPARTILTTAQKAELLKLVVTRRYSQGA